jgi:hypothetical protein
MPAVQYQPGQYGYHSSSYTQQVPQFSGNDPKQHAQALQNHFAGRREGLYLQMHKEDPKVQSALLDNSKELNKFLGLHKTSGEKIAYWNAPFALAHAATMMSRPTDAGRALKRLEHVLVKHPVRSAEHEQSVEHGFTHLLDNLGRIGNTSHRRHIVHIVSAFTPALSQSSRAGIARAAESAAAQPGIDPHLGARLRALALRQPTVAANSGRHRFEQNFQQAPASGYSTSGSQTAGRNRNLHKSPQEQIAELKQSHWNDGHLQGLSNGIVSCLRACSAGKTEDSRRALAWFNRSYGHYFGNVDHKSIWKLQDLATTIQQDVNSKKSPQQLLDHLMQSNWTPKQLEGLRNGIHSAVQAMRQGGGAASTAVQNFNREFGAIRGPLTDASRQTFEQLATLIQNRDTSRTPAPDMVQDLLNRSQLSIRDLHDFKRAIDHCMRSLALGFPMMTHHLVSWFNQTYGHHCGTLNPAAPERFQQLSHAIGQHLQSVYDATYGTAAAGRG